MHINVKDILAGDLGYRKDFEISDEHPSLPDLSLADGINGAVAVTRLEDGLLVAGQAKAELNLECHRCLRPYSQTFQVEFGGQFRFGAFLPEADVWPIQKDMTVDIAPLIRQELLLAVPIQLLDLLDCPGLCVECGEINQPGHKHKSHLTIDH